MNQSERRQYLIRELIAEDKEYQRLAIPKDEGGQKVLLRALMNVRAPKPCGEEFLKIQDAYLQEEIRKEGITDADSLTPVRDELYIWQGDITTLRCDAIVNAANGGMTGCYVPNHRCIDNMIHSKSGIALRLCCADLMKNRGMRNQPGVRRSHRLLTSPAAISSTRSDRSSMTGSAKRMRDCLRPATAPVWNWQTRTGSGASHSAVFPRENSTSRMSWQRKSP